MDTARCHQRGSVCYHLVVVFVRRSKWQRWHPPWLACQACRQRLQQVWDCCPAPTPWACRPTWLPWTLWTTLLTWCPYRAHHCWQLRMDWCHINTPWYHSRRLQTLANRSVPMGSSRCLDLPTSPNLGQSPVLRTPTFSSWPPADCHHLLPQCSWAVPMPMLLYLRCMSLCRH